MADVIAAVATGQAASAIGILRLSGEGAAAVAGRVFTPNAGPLEQAPNRKLVLGSLRDRDGRVIDQAMAVYTRGPHSYTGEDTVELQCHGAPIVLREGLEALFAAGARQAGPGEFTKRAFLNGRMDLSQAEAVADLIDAETAEAAASAAGQLGGAVSRRADGIFSCLTAVLTHFQAVVDYPEEDLEPFETADCRAKLAEAGERLRTLEDGFARGKILKSGAACALIGRPNTGKSSLLNALAGYDRVIVSDVAGTTRDTVEERIRLGGVTLRLTDTAGIRGSADALEQMGVERARDAARQAELALLVLDSAAPLTEEDRAAMDAARSAKRVIAVLNKSDLPPVLAPDALPFETVLPISAKTGAGLEALSEAVAAAFGGATVCDGSLLTNARQYDAVRRARRCVEAALAAMEQGLTPDAALSDAEAAAEALGELTGRSVRDEVVSGIFSRFCVGK